MERSTKGIGITDPEIHGEMEIYLREIIEAMYQDPDQGQGTESSTPPIMNQATEIEQDTDQYHDHLVSVNITDETCVVLVNLILTKAQTRATPSKR